MIEERVIKMALLRNSFDIKHQLSQKVCNLVIIHKELRELGIIHLVRTQYFPKKQHLLPLDIPLLRTCTYQG